MNADIRNRRGQALTVVISIALQANYALTQSVVLIAAK